MKTEYNKNEANIHIYCTYQSYVSFAIPDTMYIHTSSHIASLGRCKDLVLACPTASVFVARASSRIFNNLHAARTHHTSPTLPSHFHHTYTIDPSWLLYPHTPFSTLYRGSAAAIGITVISVWDRAPFPYLHSSIYSAPVAAQYRA